MACISFGAKRGTLIFRDAATFLNFVDLSDYFLLHLHLYFTFADQDYYTYFRKFLPTVWAHVSVYYRGADDLEHEPGTRISFDCLGVV